MQLTSDTIIEVLARTTEALGSSLDVSQVSRHAVQLPIPYLCDWSLIFWVQPSGEITLQNEFAKDESLSQTINTEWDELLSLRKVLLHGETQLSSLENGYQVLSLPLYSNSQITHIFCLGNQSQRSFSDEIRVLAEELGARISHALQNALMYEEAIRNKQEVAAAKKAAEEASLAKTTFLAAMSHEIRTPLTAILGFSELLLDQNEQSPLANDFAKRIRDNGDHLMRLIDDILNVSKVESGKIELDIQEINLLALLTGLNHHFASLAEEKSIRFSIECDTKIPIYFKSDGTRLRQILTNLINNAIKFTTQGEVLLKLHYEEPFLVICVCDTGPGLTRAQAERLFTPFTQAKASDLRQFGGTGLGLMLSRQLARLLGGDVELNQFEVGKGCTFQLTLPVSSYSGNLEKICEVVNARETGGHESLKFDLEGIKILLVDDSKDNRLLVQHILKPTRAIFATAEDGETGLNLAKTEKFDLILMDINMPNMSGKEVTEILRAEGCSTPILALTACALSSEKAEIMTAGFNDFLTKPINKNQLLSSISDWTKR